MNKKLKIATAAVSVVMAGTMVVGMVGCTPKPPVSDQPKYEVAAADADIKDVTLNINIGDAAQRSISFGYGELLSGTVKLPDGKDYSSSSLKPAWAAFQDMVGCKFKDVWQNASKKLTNAVTASTEGARLSDMDIITDGAANVATNKADLLDLYNYLDEMPNYKKFLDENPIVRLSLTSDTNHGSMYYAPYFDGNNDIEKYELFKTNWVATLLDTDGGDETTTYAAHGTAKKTNGGDYANTLTTATAIESFMGKTGKWTAEVLDKDGKKLEAGITVNYDKALAAAKGTDGLGAAVTAAAGKAYTGDSGNIVDIMNFAINEKQGAVTGAQLKKILQEYVKVAYYVGNTDTAFYTQSGYKLSDVFNSYSAAWDVDLYAAIGRVLVTNPGILKSGKAGNTIGGENATPHKNLYLLSARKNDMQRMSDTVSLVGQLYGVRGLESKNLYSYIGSDGKIKDPRGDAKSYEAMEKFNAFWKEGLIYTGASGNNADQSYYADNTPEALSCYDYVNTQTPVGFTLQGATTKSYNAEEGYNYTPIITPVSKWNDGKEQVMRFTESWRTTKDTGFCVPVANVKDNPVKLRAVLTFIDKMFSNDGQILLTYGPKATSATAGDGYWYNDEANDAQVAAGTYFEYGGKKLYSTVEYGGVYQPHILENVYNAYYGKSTTQNVKFDGSGLTYAGGDDVVAPEEALELNKDNKKVVKSDYQKKKDAVCDYDVYCVDSKGKFNKIAAGAKMSAAVYVVEATVAANTDVTGAAHYIVDANGKLAAKDGKRVALISDTVSQWTTNSTLNYTNFARYVIGSALPIGNKLQSFEFQLTSTMGRTGALVVNAGLGLPSDPTDGVIKHTVNVMTKNPWYTVVPTLLPYTEADTQSLSGAHVRIYTGDEGNYFSNNKNDNTNLYWQIIKYGMDAGQITAKYSGLGLGSGTTTAQAIMQKLEDVDGFTAYVNIKNKAWQASKKFYESIKNS